MSDKKKENTALENKRPVSSVIAELPDELKFICNLCEKAQNMSERPKKDCYYFNAVARRCPQMERLVSLHVSMKQELQMHRKYINAFRKEELYTEDSIKDLYDKTCKVDSLPSFNEFIDYCRAILNLEIV